MGTVGWFDPKSGGGRIVGSGGRYSVRALDLERAARVPRTRVRFDIRREGGLVRAVRARLLDGTRVSPRQGRFGDLVGAAHPDEKGQAPLTHRHPALEPGVCLPQAVAVRWTEAMEEGDVETALRLYAGDARVHAGGRNLTGIRQISRFLEGNPLLGSRPLYVEITGEDPVLIRWGSVAGSGTSERTWLRVVHGEISEQWTGPRDSGLRVPPAGRAPGPETLGVRDERGPLSARGTGSDLAGGGSRPSGTFPISCETPAIVLQREIVLEPLRHLRHDRCRRCDPPRTMLTGDHPLLLSSVSPSP